MLWLNMILPTNTRSNVALSHLHISSQVCELIRLVIDHKLDVPSTIEHVRYKPKGWAREMKVYGAMNLDISRRI